MKKVCMMALAAMCLLSVEVMAQDWAKLQRYEQANKELMEQTNDGKRVVFLGNSITEGWPKQRPEFFSENGYIGRGISGQTSSHFLVRFRDDVINLKPALVVINAGTNDVAENAGPYSEERTLGNIVSMVELARTNKIKVIMTAVLPAAAFSWRPNLKDAAVKIASLNQRLKEYARKNKIVFVDYYSPLVAGEEGALNPAYTNDGVHPTAEGYAVMEPLIQEAIRKVLKKR